MNARLFALVVTCASLSLAACALESDPQPTPERESYLSSTARADATTPDSAKPAVLQDAAALPDSSAPVPESDSAAHSTSDGGADSGADGGEAVDPIGTL